MDLRPLQLRQREFRFEIEVTRESSLSVNLLITPAEPNHGIPAEIRVWKVMRPGRSDYQPCTPEEIEGFEAQVATLGVPPRGDTWIHDWHQPVQKATPPKPIAASSVEYPDAALQFEIKATSDRKAFLYIHLGVRGKVPAGSTNIAYVNKDGTLGVMFEEHNDESGEQLVIEFKLENLPADLQAMFRTQKPKFNSELRSFVLGTHEVWKSLTHTDAREFDPFNL